MPDRGMRDAKVLGGGKVTVGKVTGGGKVDGGGKVTSGPTIRAAGAVLWRPSGKHGIRIAVVHRPRYDDISLPKGKAEPGETAPMTAAREVLEETGFDSAIGRRLRTVSYSVDSGSKLVTYFSARAIAGEFAPNHEVDEIAWLSPTSAAKRLTYRADRAVLRALREAPAELSHLVLVRHAKAGHRESYDGDDAARPLDDRGRKQALALADQVAPFVPIRMTSAPQVRCCATVEPLAGRFNLPIAIDPLLSEDAYRDGPAAVRRQLVALASDGSSGGAAVACSQGGVIPGVIKSLASRSSISVGNVATPKGAYWLLTLAGDRLVQADPYDAPMI